MNKNIKIVLFTIIVASILGATALLITRHYNKQVQPHLSDELGKHLLERMNHRIIDTSILKSSICFEQNIFDFGTIKTGDEVMHRFKFTNTGNNPLIIFNVQGTCGCTVPAWSNEPVNPGDTGNIAIKFNSVNESGFQNKKVRVFANSKPMETDIFFKANVIN